MTQEDILTLAKAGFSASQIAALNVVNQSVQTVQPVQTMQPTQSMQAAQPLDAMSQQIAALTQAVQSSSIMQAQQPKAQTADEVLAEIINPPTILAAQNKGGVTK